MEGYHLVGGRGREGKKVQGSRSKIGREMLRSVQEMVKLKNLHGPWKSTKWWGRIAGRKGNTGMRGAKRKNLGQL